MELNGLFFRNPLVCVRTVSGFGIFHYSIEKWVSRKITSFVQHIFILETEELQYRNCCVI